MGYPFIIVGMVLNLYVYVLIARVILDLIQVFSRDWRPQGFMLAAAEIIYTLTDPPVKAVRKVIPPLRLGGIALDLGFIIVFIAVQVVAGILIRFGYSML